jgi:hypothetical protein
MAAPGIRRFPRLPRKIESHAELTELIRQGQGFIFNNRDDRKMLHQVKCESLEVMSTRAYEKLFFENLDEAKDWLDRNYGKDGWVVCGRCNFNPARISTNALLEELNKRRIAKGLDPIQG